MPDSGGGTPAGYDAARTGLAVRVHPSRGWLELSGRDVVSFLHGILTNDVRALQPGEGSYAAWLTPQGRMISDLVVLRTGEGAWLQVPGDLASELAARMDGVLFTEDVRVSDRSGDLATLEVCGPAAADALAAIAGNEQGPLARLAPFGHVTAASGGLLAATDRLGVTGYEVAVPRAQLESWQSGLRQAGAVELSEAAAEALRLEGGVPQFGTDMTADTIPLEAGIERRAISMTKGCYVGQEIIIRILHRGHGRVARRLLRLRVGSSGVPESGARLFSGDRPAGQVTSAAWSPRLDAPIGFGWVHRDAGEEPALRLGSPDGPPVSILPDDQESWRRASGPLPAP